MMVKESQQQPTPDAVSTQNDNLSNNSSVESDTRTASTSTESSRMYDSEKCVKEYHKTSDEFQLGRSVWIDESGVKLICQQLGFNVSVLEYGSGGSTTTFGKFTRNWVSLEHDEDWGQRVQQLIDELSLEEKVHLYTVPNDLPWDWGKGDGSAEQFKSYLEFAGSLNQKFDLIIDDGRARVSVSESALDKKLFVSNESKLIIHDWEREEYKKIVSEQGYRILFEDKKSKRELAVLQPPESYSSS